MANVDQSMDQSFETFILILNFTTLYLQRFKDTGYDDMDLLFSVSMDELNQMFDIVGMSTKLGHVLKFKKSLESVKTKRSEAAGSDRPLPGPFTPVSQPVD